MNTDAMEQSVYDPSEIKRLLQNALTDKINDREVFMKGIDYSYYYEEEWTPNCVASSPSSNEIHIDEFRKSKSITRILKIHVDSHLLICYYPNRIF